MIQNVGRAYTQAGPVARRHWAHAFFDEIGVDVDGIVYSRPTDLMAQLMAEDLVERLEKVWVVASRSKGMTCAPRSATSACRSASESSAPPQPATERATTATTTVHSTGRERSRSGTGGLP
jgi:hypothetical protein